MCALAIADLSVLPDMPMDADLFGRILRDTLAGGPVEYALRRDDRWLGYDSSARYFRSWEAMPPHQRCLLNHARGRVLDVGAGAGQHSLALQERGLDVVAIDASPGAVEVCRTRGVGDARVMDARRLDVEEDSIDTVLFMGSNLAIGGSPEGLRGLLQRLHRLVRPGGQILAEYTDYTATRDASHLRYHAVNVARGRYPGAIRLRLEYAGMCGPEFDWLLLQLADLRQICAESGWKLCRCVQVDAHARYAIGIARV